MPSDTGGGVIIIRRKVQEKLQAIKAKVKPWHLYAAVALISFVLGAVIF